MKKTLYLRILIAYFFFGLFGFFAVATIVSRLTAEYCIRDKARTLYGEATRISDTYALQLYKSKVSLEEVQAQFQSGSGPLTGNLCGKFRFHKPRGQLLYHRDLF